MGGGNVMPSLLLIFENCVLTADLKCQKAVQMCPTESIECALWLRLNYNNADNVNIIQDDSWRNVYTPT